MPARERGVAVLVEPGGVSGPGSAVTAGIGTVLDGRYELVALLGRGGMGAVYRAHDHRLGRDVAVKLLDHALAHDEQYLARFQREARAAASLNHPGIVGVYDRGEHDGSPFTVMEHVDGPTLGDVLRSEGRLEPDRALLLAAAVADALGAAHRIGVVHRDVKPSNVLVTPDGHVKVTDFGIARAATDVTLTATDSVLGSIPYVAPEQVRGEPATPASDVYGLGCLLYALVTGHPPFRGDVAVSVLHQHLSAEPDLPSSVVPGLPPEVDDVVLHLLAKDPDERPADGSEAADVLREPDAASRTRVLPVIPMDVLERTRAIGPEPASATQVLPEHAHGDPTWVDAAGDEPPLRWGRRLAVLVLLAAVLVAVALFGDRLTSRSGQDAPPSDTPSAPGPAAPVDDPPAAEPSPEASPEPSPESPGIGDLIEQLGGMLADGRGASMDAATADDLAERLSEVAQEVGEGDWKEARDEARGLRKELDQRTRAGDVSADRAAALSEVLDRLELLLRRAHTT